MVPFTSYFSVLVVIFAITSFKGAICSSRINLGRGGARASNDHSQLYAYVRTFGTSPVTNELYVSCGGAFISEYSVLTSANCRITSDHHDQSPSMIITENEKVFWSDECSTSGDMALLKLAEPVDRSRVVPSCGPGVMPQGADDLFYIRMETTSWEHHDPERIKVSRMAEDIGCKTHPTDGSNQNKVCASDAAGFQCREDIGGPLIIHSANHKCLYGLSSYGGWDKEIKVFTRVSSFRDWISNPTQR